jgi:hypothetical protein
MYALTYAVIYATFIEIDSISLYLTGIASIVCIMLVLFNNRTRLAAILILLFLSVFSFFMLDEMIYRFPEIFEMVLMISGHIPYDPYLGRMVVWVLNILLAFFTVVFMLHQFNFYILSLSGTLIFLFIWISGFIRNETAFLIFLAVFCVLLIRRTNKSVVNALVALPLCILIVWAADSQMPAESDIYVRRYVSQSNITSRLNDFFYELFTPTHFSFQSTGFSGAGGRLGGPVTQSNRTVMTVKAPGRTYLSGAVSNTYMGDRWLPTLQDGAVNTHGLPPSHFEMLETAASLIRNATHRDTRAGMPMHSDIPARRFRILRMMENTEYHLYEHTVTTPEMESVITVYYSDEGNYHFGWSFGMRADLIQQIGEDGNDWEDFWQTRDIDAVWAESMQQSEDAREYISQIIEEGRFLEYYKDELSVYPQTETNYWHTYMPFETLSIEQGTNRTGTVFRPPRAFDLSFNEDSFDYTPYIQITPAGDMQTPDFMSHGTGYQTRFLDADTRLSFVEYILRETNEGVYKNHTFQEKPTFEGNTAYTGDRWFYGYAGGVPTALPALPVSAAGFAEIIALYSSPVRTTPLKDSAQFMEYLNLFSEILAQYAYEVRQNFLDVPETVPQRVHDLALEITADKTNDFDRVTAIRDYLLQFPYTLTPEALPRGRCFVDFFLFDTQEGYCTYFASAMAVMSRIAGVPSRYTEGFVLPPSANPNEYVTVTNRMAHAWVEVYLEGFGWHIIEATPTYAFLMNPDLISEEGITSGGFDRSTIDRVQNMMREFNVPEINRVAIIRERPEREQEEEETETQEEPEEVYSYTIPISFIALSLLLILAVIILHRKYKLHCIEKLSYNAQTQIYFTGILSITAYAETPPTSDETPKSYALRIEELYNDSVCLRDLTELYNKAKYSSAECTKDEADSMKKAYRNMLKLLRRTKPLHVFLYLVYLRGAGRLNP